MEAFILCYLKLSAPHWRRHILCSRASVSTPVSWCLQFYFHRRPHLSPAQSSRLCVAFVTCMLCVHALYSPSMYEYVFNFTQMIPFITRHLSVLHLMELIRVFTRNLVRIEEKTLFSVSLTRVRRQFYSSLLTLAILHLTSVCCAQRVPRSDK